MVPLQTHGCYNTAIDAVIDTLAVVPLQTHGCYNDYVGVPTVRRAVVPLQTHGCYNPRVGYIRCVNRRGSPTDSRVL